MMNDYGIEYPLNGPALSLGVDGVCVHFDIYNPNGQSIFLAEKQKSSELNFHITNEKNVSNRIRDIFLELLEQKLAVVSYPMDTQTIVLNFKFKSNVSVHFNVEHRTATFVLKETLDSVPNDYPFTFSASRYLKFELENTEFKYHYFKPEPFSGTLYRCLERESIVHILTYTILSKLDGSYLLETEGKRIIWVDEAQINFGEVTSSCEDWQDKTFFASRENAVKALYYDVFESIKDSVFTLNQLAKVQVDIERLVKELNIDVKQM